jgi:outer membrane protein TolC
MLKAVLGSTLLLSCLLAAGPAVALDLGRATDIALANSHELKSMHYQTLAAQEGETIADAGYLPRVTLGGQHVFAEHWMELELLFGGQDVIVPSIQPYTDVGLQANWEIFSGFQTTNQAAAARANTQAAVHGERRAEERLRATIRTLFYRALGSQVLVDVADQNLKTLEGHLQDVNARVRSGVSTRFDTLRVEVQIEEARTEKIAAESQVAVQRARFYEALGVADDGARLDGELPTDFTRYETSKLTLAHLQREDRLAQQERVTEAERLAKASKAHWLPRISLFGTHEFYNNYNHSIWDEDEHFKTQSIFGVRFSWNLFDGGADLAAQKQAALNQLVAKERLAQFDNDVPAEFEESKRRFEYDVINFKAKQSSVKKAEEAVRLARGGLRAGTRTNTEVLDAVVDLNRAKAAVVKSQVDAIDALGTLELTLGHAL